MVAREPVLEIRETGPRTVVAFGNVDTWDFHFLARCEDELDNLVENVVFESLAFDLANIKQISSTLLGIFVSLQQSGFKIELLNISDDVKDVLDTTHLKSFFTTDPDETS